VQGWDELESGRLDAARRAFWRDAEEAERTGDDERLGLAALGLGGIWIHEHRSTIDHSRVVTLQRRALERIDPDSSLARRLRIRLSAEQGYGTGQITALLDELAAARRCGEAVALAEALSLTHQCLLAPQHAAHRLALADELIAVAPATGRPRDITMGLMWRTVDLFLAGDRRATRSLAELRARLEVNQCDAIAFVVAALDVTVAMRAGRLAEAEELAVYCFDLGTAVGDADALPWYGVQLVAIRWLQGRGGEVMPLLSELVDSPTVAEWCSGFDAALAAVASATGDTALAASALASLCAGGLATVPPSSLWLATMCGAAEAAHLLGDTAAATHLAELLEPFAELPIMVSLGVACFGSTHRPLGLAALTLGDTDGAIDHLTAAVSVDLAVGNLPSTMINRATLATALRARGAPGDHRRADELLATAIADARRFGMDARVAQWAGEQENRAEQDVQCARDGQLWAFHMGDARAVVTDSVGVRHLAELIANPGVEIAALELTSGHQSGDRTGLAQPILDPAAKRAYRRRLQELRDDVADAEACGDPERASRARVVLDRFVEELSAATGLGGRDRHFTDDAERARVSVQKAIKRALRAIADANTDVGRALNARVTTGTRCVYRPA
jgi:hypothetical protein